MEEVVWCIKKEVSVMRKELNEEFVWNKIAEYVLCVGHFMQNDPNKLDSLF